MWIKISGITVNMDTVTSIRTYGSILTISLVNGFSVSGTYESEAEAKVIQNYIGKLAANGFGVVDIDAEVKKRKDKIRNANSNGGNSINHTDCAWGGRNL